MKRCLHFLFIGFLIMLLLGSTKIIEGKTFIVNSTVDSSDANPGDGIAQTVGGTTTLRAAIQEANTTAEIDTIDFNLAGPTPYKIIIKNPGLPHIIQPLIIDGNSQPNYNGQPVIEIEAGENTAGDGFVIAQGSPGVVISGLSIGGFENYGINIESNEDTVRSCYIGISADGITPFPNGGYGIRIYGGSHNVIGGIKRIDENVISGNKYSGINIYGDDHAGKADSNLIQNNYIGTNPDGTIKISNGTGSANDTKDGITLTGLPGWITRNKILNNLISGNYGNGIQLIEADHTIIQGNIIGTDKATLRSIPNGTGIFVENASFNQIGGNGKNDANVISGNYSHAIEIQELKYYSTSAEANGNIIQGNIIGTDKSGTKPVHNPNGYSSAIEIFAADSTLIGGPKSSDGNLIS